MCRIMVKINGLGLKVLYLLLIEIILGLSTIYIIESVLLMSYITYSQKSHIIMQYKPIKR